MLKTLTIKNLILIEKAHINFEMGLTVITGETGAGKTALIDALRLLVGERADVSKIRSGCDKAFLQASFSLNETAEMRQLFDDAALSFPDEEDLIVTREIQAGGKSRTFVSGELVPLIFLQKIGRHLINFIGQHATIELKESHKQREILDLYAGIDLKKFQNLWKKENALLEDLEKLRKEKQGAAQRKEFFKSQLKELEKAQLKEGEEESLFEEYTLLSNAQNLECGFNEAIETADTTLDLLRRLQKQIQNIEVYGLQLEETNTLSKESTFQIEELRAVFQKFLSKLESNPSRLHFLEERIALLEELKKKYGNDLKAVFENSQKELAQLEGIDLEEEGLETTCKKAQAETQEEVQKIRTQREKSAKKLQEALTEVLQQLNMEAAEVEICLQPTVRNKSGEDEVIFFLKANKGEKKGPIKDCISGGELSRLLLAIQIALVQKMTPKTLVFDEIDANVGGKTATRIGKYLHQLAQKDQVLCITHFPQVARFGDQHLCVKKIEMSERTIGQIIKLTEKNKDAEILRMLGGADLPHLKQNIEWD